MEKWSLFHFVSGQLACVKDVSPLHEEDEENKRQSVNLLLGVDQDAIDLKEPSYSQGNPHFNRGVYPFRATEVLTEAKRGRIRELFSQALRDENRRAFFIPTQVRYLPKEDRATPPSPPALQEAEWVEAKAARYDGGYAYPILLEDRAVATKIDYQVFVNGQPTRSGVLRILAGPGAVVCSDSWNLDYDQPEIEFKVERDGNDFVLLARCLHDEQKAPEAVKLTLLVRFNSIARPSERVATNQAPVWVTGENLGNVVGPVTLVASDPEEYPVTYTSFDLPDGLTLNSETGELTPNGASGTFTFAVNASDGVLQSSRTFTVSVNSTPR